MGFEGGYLGRAKGKIGREEGGVIIVQFKKLTTGKKHFFSFFYFPGAHSSEILNFRENMDIL